MAGSSQYLPFAAGTGANTLTPTAYAALSTLLANGFTAGVAQSQQFNTLFRQASVGVAGLAAFMANQGLTVNDDGSSGNFAANVLQAIQAVVQSKLGNFSAYGTITGATTLTAAQSGSAFELVNSGYTVTLPAPTTANLNFTMYVASASATVTIATPSGNIINAGISSSSISVTTSTALELLSDGTNWIVLSGAGAAQLAANGYQKLPSGLLLQWGSGATVSGTVGVVFPVAFTTTVYSITQNVTNASSTGGWAVMESTSPSLTGYTAYTQAFGASFNTPAAGNVAFNWIAIGK